MILFWTRSAHRGLANILGRNCNGQIASQLFRQAATSAGLADRRIEGSMHGDHCSRKLTGTLKLIPRPPGGAGNGEARRTIAASS